MDKDTQRRISCQERKELHLPVEILELKGRVSREGRHILAAWTMNVGDCNANDEVNMMAVGFKIESLLG